MALARQSEVPLDAAIAVILMAIFNAAIRPVLLTLVAPRSR